jgi:hypothetical protein
MESFPTPCIGIIAICLDVNMNTFWKHDYVKIDCCNVHKQFHSCVILGLLSSLTVKIKTVLLAEKNNFRFWPRDSRNACICILLCLLLRLDYNAYDVLTVKKAGLSVTPFISTGSCALERGFVVSYRSAGFLQLVWLLSVVWYPIKHP